MTDIFCILLLLLEVNRVVSVWHEEEICTGEICVILSILCMETMILFTNMTKSAAN